MELGGKNGTNSVTNWLMSGTKGQPKPEVGMGATILAYTDRYAGTIIDVKEINGGWDIVIQEDKAKRTDSNGMSEMQTYEYSPDPKAPTYNYRFESAKPEKGWRPTYTKANGRVCFIQGGNGLRIGERRKYNDFSF